jgi:hypothetical protein
MTRTFNPNIEFTKEQEIFIRDFGGLISERTAIEANRVLNLVQGDELRMAIMAQALALIVNGVILSAMQVAEFDPLDDKQYRKMAASIMEVVLDRIEDRRAARLSMKQQEQLVKLFGRQS